MSKEKIKKEKKEKSKVRIWIENILEVLIVVSCLAFSIIMIASPGGVKDDYSKINVSYMPVLSNSMSGTFEKGDLIFGKKIEKDEKGKDRILDIGEVAIFVVNNPTQSEYQFINTHRIAGYFYEYKDSENNYFVGYDKLFHESSVTNYETALAYAESQGWKDFKILGYKTSGDNKSIYYKDGDVNGELLDEKNTNLVDASYTPLDNVIGTWTGKKLSGVGGVITWIQKPLNFFLVIMIPLILLFLYNIWTVIKYILEVKTEKARKLALEEAHANAIDEEEIKRKAVEEYMKKMGIDPSSLPTENKESDVKEESSVEEVTSLEVKEETPSKEENEEVVVEEIKEEEKVEEPVVKKAHTKKKTTTSSSTKKTTTTTKKSTGTKKTTSSSKKTTSKKSSEVK